MLSRVAENLYWLGRDLERVENIARMAEVSHAVAIEAGGAEGGEQQAWDAVLAATGSLALYAEAHAEEPLLSPAGTTGLLHPAIIASIGTAFHGLA